MVNCFCVTENRIQIEVGCGSRAFTQWTGQQWCNRKALEIAGETKKNTSPTDA